MLTQTDMSKPHTRSRFYSLQMISDKRCLSKNSCPYAEVILYCLRKNSSVLCKFPGAEHFLKAGQYVSEQLQEIHQSGRLTLHRLSDNNKS